MKEKEIKELLKKECHKPGAITFFLGEAKRMTGMAAAFDEHPERRVFFRGSASYEFRVILLAIEFISSEYPEQSKEATTLVKEMKDRESQIKQMFNLEN